MSSKPMQWEMGIRVLPLYPHGGDQLSNYGIVGHPSTTGLALEGTNYTWQIAQAQPSAQDAIRLRGCLRRLDAQIL